MNGEVGPNGAYDDVTDRVRGQGAASRATSLAGALTCWIAGRRLRRYARSGAPSSSPNRIDCHAAWLSSLAWRREEYCFSFRISAKASIPSCCANPGP